MLRNIGLLIVCATMTACANEGSVETVSTSPAKCFYDSNQNRQRCSNALSFADTAASDPRAYRHPIGPKYLPFGSYIFGDNSKKSTAYQFGYDARFEAGYRSPSRFDTTIYRGEAVQ